MRTNRNAGLQTGSCFLLMLILLGCSRERTPARASSKCGIETNRFAVLETELTPGILIHSDTKYLGLFADSESPPSHIAFATHTGPRSFRRSQKLKADEMEEGWLLLWGQTAPPWVVYLQHKPLALSFDTNGLHLSFAKSAGDVVLLPLHGTSTNIDTRKWSEFLTRDPLLRIRYWASVLREFPFECQTSIGPSNSVRQSFRFHTIRDDWGTKPLQLAPISPPLARMADEQLKRKLMDLKMATPFGPYMAFERTSDWSSSFPPHPNLNLNPNLFCAWATLGDSTQSSTNTALIYAIGAPTSRWPRIPTLGSIQPIRDQPAPKSLPTLLNRNSRLISYD
ncbi:MAG TPA: hypothetical protein VJ063_16175 [Verrucomicrobiae bacterium]|nr:hypothetical protein [Verrucomicrobiae bacterium]